MKRLCLFLMILVLCRLGHGLGALDDVSGIPLPQSIQSFVEGWNAKSYWKAKDAFSRDFSIDQVPPEYTKEALTQIFSNAPVKIASCIAKKTTQMDNHTVYTVSMVTLNGIREIDFTLDKEDKIVSTSLFQAANPGTATSGGSSIKQYAEVPFRLQNNLILIEAEINGVKGSFILDSGAPMLVLNSVYDPDRPVQIIGMSAGVGGAIEGVGIRKLEMFRWAGAAYSDFDCVTMDLSHLESELGESFAGLISKAELEPFETYIDYENSIIRLYGLRKDGSLLAAHQPPKPVHQVQFELFGHIPVIKTTVGKKKLNLGLDTGAMANLIDTSLYPKYRKLLTDASVDTLMGADGQKVEVHIGYIEKNQVGKIKFERMRYCFSDISHINKAYDIKLDGLLGHPFLSQRPMSINYRKQILSFY